MFIAPVWFPRRKIDRDPAAATGILADGDLTGMADRTVILGETNEDVTTDVTTDGTVDGTIDVTIGVMIGVTTDVTIAVMTDVMIDATTDVTTVGVMTVAIDGRYGDSLYGIHCDNECEYRICIVGK